MGGIRCGGAGAKLRHALWLEFAAGVTENPWPRWRAAADHGMEACGVRQRRRAGGRPWGFGRVGALEVCLLRGIGLALFRGVKLPPLRIVLLLGLLHMALAQGRAAGMLALREPMALAAPP